MRGLQQAISRHLRSVFDSVTGAIQGAEDFVRYVWNMPSMAYGRWLLVIVGAIAFFAVVRHFLTKGPSRPR